MYRVNGQFRNRGKTYAKRAAVGGGILGAVGALGSRRGQRRMAIMASKLKAGSRGRKAMVGALSGSIAGRRKVMSMGRKVGKLAKRVDFNTVRAGAKLGRRLLLRR